MNKKLLILATVLSVGALVGCGKKAATKSDTTSVVASQQAAGDTVASVKAIAEALTPGAFSTQKYTVTGYVVNDPYVNTKYNSYSFDLADTADGTNTIYAYSCELASGVTAPVKGSKVTVSGYLTLFVKEGQPNKAEIAGSKEVEYPKITACDAQGTSTGGGTSTTTSQVVSQVDGKLVMNVTAASSTSLSGTGNNAALFGWDESLINVTDKQSKTVSSNDGKTYGNPAAVAPVSKGNGATELRIYAGSEEAGTVTFTMSGKTIETVKVVAETADKTCSGKATAALVVKSGDTTLTGNNDVYTVNASSFSITSSATSGQLHITSLEISYK